MLLWSQPSVQTRSEYMLDFNLTGGRASATTVAGLRSQVCLAPVSSLGLLVALFKLGLHLYTSSVSDTIFTSLEQIFRPVYW